MTEDLQGLLEKINRDGVEKAEAKAAEIVAAAEKKAAALVTAAEQTAAAAKVEAEQAAKDYAARAEESIRQAARDVLIRVEQRVTALLESLLAKDVNAALADVASVKKLVTEVVAQLATTGEIVAGADLAAALKAQLAELRDFTVVLDETNQTGFSVKLDGGRVEHAFTGPVIAGELARRLRPDLAKLLK